MSTLSLKIARSEDKMDHNNDLLCSNLTGTDQKLQQVVCFRRLEEEVEEKEEDIYLTQKHQQSMTISEH